jgi:hypothetical protein
MASGKWRLREEYLPNKRNSPQIIFGLQRDRKGIQEEEHVPGLSEIFLISL